MPQVLEDILMFLLKYILPLLLAFIINKIISKAAGNKRLHGKIHLILLRSIIEAVIWVAAIIVVLSGIPNFTKGWDAVIAGSGIVAGVVGLATQSSLGNVFAGISMSASKSRPFDMGDRVKIGTSDPGYVVDITLRHVVIRTYLNEVIFIPNSVVGNTTVINYTATDGYGFPVEVYVAYESDVPKAKAIMEDIINTHKNHYGSPANVLCKLLGDSGVMLKGTVVTKTFETNPTTCSEVLLEVLKRFNEEGIEIPYNKIKLVENK